MRRLDSALVWLVMSGLFLAPMAEARHKSYPRNDASVTITPMVVAAEPEAAQAGMDILNKGGTAIDAAVAIQATLSLVEPQSSGIGGGAFMTYYDAKSSKVVVYNGREKAPQSAQPDRFLGADKKPYPPVQLFTSGLATGVPGAMFMLEKAQSTYGRLKWSQLFDTPIALAETGFEIHPRLGYNLQSRQFPEKQTPDFQAYFSDGKGGLLKAGDHLKNPAYAATLKSIAADGMRVFRQGALAQAIVDKVHEAPLPSDMSLSDLTAYQPKIETPLCTTYRTFKLCGPPPPSSEALLFNALKIMEKFPIHTWGKDDPRSWAVLIEAERLMYADRDKYLGDPDFVPVPVKGLMSEAYAKARAASITVGKPSASVSFGIPPGAPKFLDDKTIEPGGTTHFVVMDKWGNAVSMTTTVEFLFGTGRMVGGFFLNNQLTDFSWSPTTPDKLRAANGVEGGKRPRSAMSPTLVFDKAGKLYAMIGSPGGPSIVAYNLKALVGMLDWDLSVKDAVALPNVIAKDAAIRIEAERMDPKILEGMKAMGYQITVVTGEDSGLNGMKRKSDGSFEGAPDPRREGVALSGK